MQKKYFVAENRLRGTAVLLGSFINNTGVEAQSEDVGLVSMSRVPTVSMQTYTLGTK